LHFAVMNGSEQVVRALLDSGADVTVQNRNECTPLHFAAGNNKETIVMMLLDAGAD
ncbi:ankyrin repeat-containing domain protein, partial [Baffinella frigidus]